MSPPPFVLTFPYVSHSISPLSSDISYVSPIVFSHFPILGRPTENFNQVWTSLTDLAYSLIFGASLNSKSYKEAVNVLEERFGNKQMLIFC